MTKTMTKTPLTPGSQFHFVNTGLTFSTSADDMTGASSQVATRGQTVTVTASLVEASRDRFGHSWLDLVDDPGQQVARWGKVYFSRGPAPEDMSPWTPGSPDHQIAYDAEKQRIMDTELDEDARAAALSRLNSSPLGQGLPRRENTFKYLRDES